MTTTFNPEVNIRIIIAVKVDQGLHPDTNGFSLLANLIQTNGITQS